jgi:tRNA (guanine-N7-)-methyltransferase
MPREGGAERAVRPRHAIVRPLVPRPPLASVFPVGHEWVVDLTACDAPLDLRALFGGGAPGAARVAMEIGPGKGEFLTGMAALTPRTWWLAAEYKRARIATIARRIARAGVENVRLVWADAGWLISRYLAPGSLDEVWINFPDPWPKRRHRRRRLIQPGFVDAITRLLAKGGTLAFVTDAADYAGEVLALLSASPALENALGPGAVADRIEGAVPTVFEQKFRAEGRRIHALLFRRRTG